METIKVGNLELFLAYKAYYLWYGMDDTEESTQTITSLDSVKVSYNDKTAYLFNCSITEDSLISALAHTFTTTEIVDMIETLSSSGPRDLTPNLITALNKVFK